MRTSKWWPVSIEFHVGLSALGRFLINTSVIRVIISSGDWSHREWKCQKVFCAIWMARSIPLSLGCAWYTEEIWKYLWGFWLGNCLPNGWTESMPKTFLPRTFLLHHLCPSHLAWWLGQENRCVLEQNVTWWREGIFCPSGCVSCSKSLMSVQSEPLKKWLRRLNWRASL